jgi:hypothetical protein
MVLSQQLSFAAMSHAVDFAFYYKFWLIAFSDMVFESGEGCRF